MTNFSEILAVAARPYANNTLGGVCVGKIEITSGEQFVPFNAIFELIKPGLNELHPDVYSLFKYFGSQDSSCFRGYMGSELLLANCVSRTMFINSDKPATWRIRWSTDRDKLVAGVVETFLKYVTIKQPTIYTQKISLRGIRHSRILGPTIINLNDVFVDYHSLAHGYRFHDFGKGLVYAVTPGVCIRLVSKSQTTLPVTGAVYPSPLSSDTFGPIGNIESIIDLDDIDTSACYVIKAKHLVHVMLNALFREDYPYEMPYEDFMMLHTAGSPIRSVEDVPSRVVESIDKELGIIRDMGDVNEVVEIAAELVDTSMERFAI